MIWILDIFVSRITPSFSKCPLLNFNFLTFFHFRQRAALKCAICSTKYCSIKCQEDDWGAHMIVCRKVPRAVKLDGCDTFFTLICSYTPTTKTCVKWKKHATSLRANPYPALERTSILNNQNRQGSISSFYDIDPWGKIHQGYISTILVFD